MRRIENNLFVYFLIFIVGFFVCYAEDGSTASVTIVNSAPTITSHSISPYAVIKDNLVNIQMTATDDINVTRKYAIIKWPGGSSTQNLPVNYTTTSVGRHNVTFFANDSNNVKTNTTDYFNIYNGRKYNITIANYNLTGDSSIIDFTFRDSAISENTSSTGNFKNLFLPETVYNIKISSDSNKNIITLKNVNLSLNPNSVFGIDKLTSFPDTQIVTYGINNTYIVGSAIIRLNYSGLSYTSESDLVFVKCDNWNFKSRSCSGSFAVKSDAKKNTNNDTFIYNTTSFSGFGIRDTGVSTGVTQTSRGGGGHRSLMGGLISIAEQIAEVAKLPFSSKPLTKKLPAKETASTGESPLLDFVALFNATTLKTIVIIMVLFVAFVLGYEISKKHGSGTVSMLKKAVSIAVPQKTNDELVISNRSRLFKKEMSQMLVTFETDQLPKPAKFLFNNKTCNFRMFNGNTKEFFKMALDSGPLMTRIGNKLVFAIKNDKKEFVSLFSGEELKIIYPNISAGNAQVYFINKTHNFDSKILYNLWKMLEPTGEKNIKIYFQKLLESVEKVNLSSAEDLKGYLRNIVTILQ